MTIASSRAGRMLLAAVLAAVTAYTSPAFAQKNGHAPAPRAAAPRVSTPRYNLPRPNYRPPSLPSRTSRPAAPKVKAPTPPKVKASTPTAARAKTPTPTTKPRTATTNVPRTARPSTAVPRSAATPRRTVPRTSSAGSYRMPTSARRYGYGRGYGSRYYAVSRYRSAGQRLNRTAISRLRSAHQNLARLDHDYGGHRVRAMQAISMAIRRLSGRSMVYSGMGSGSRIASTRLTARRTGTGTGTGATARNRMPQAQSDARMRSSLSSLTAAGNLLGNNSMGTDMRRNQALGYVRMAADEIRLGLQVR